MFVQEGQVGTRKTMPIRTVNVGQVNLAYVEAGRGEPVVFVHGIPTDYRAWNGQLEPFSSKYHMIAYSRRLAQPIRNIMDYEKSPVANNSPDLAPLIDCLAIR